MADLILIVVLLAIVGAAIFYIYKAKKRGEVCVGCPYAKQCGKCKCSSSNAEMKLKANHSN